METDATEVIHQEPGTGGKELVSLQDGFTTLPNSVNRTLLPHVITTPPVNINHAEPVNQPQNAAHHASMELLIPAINGLLIAFMEFHQTLKKSKLKL